MQRIQSVICFNGGSAGDFLKLACNQQIDPEVNYTISKSGMVLISNDFKNFANDVYDKNKTWNDIESVEISQIENSHFYLEEFKTLADRLFYIDYPESLDSVVVDVYTRKRVQNCQALVKRVKPTLPPPLQQYVNENNVKEICKIQWRKNLNAWRKNTNLAPIQLKDFFDFEKLSAIVAYVSGQTTLDLIKLHELYKCWTEKNSQLK